MNNAFPSVGNWTKAVDDIFKDIKDRNSDVRTEAGVRLRNYVEKQLQELKGEYFASFIHDVNQHIRVLTKSQVSQEVLYGITALDNLLDVEYDLHDGPFVDQWVGYLRSALHQSENSQVADSASRCLGRFARIYLGSVSREVVDFEMRWALEGLQKNNVFRRHTAVLVLAQLIEHVPSLINLQHVEAFFDVMWLTLTGSTLSLRQDTVEVLKWSIVFVLSRSESSSKLYKKIYMRAIKELRRSVNPDYIHGSILVLMALMEHAAVFMRPNYDEVYSAIFHMKDNKSNLIKCTVVLAIRSIAKYYPSRFGEQNLHEAMRYFLNVSRRVRETAFDVIGDIALVVKHAMLNEVDDVFLLIQSILKKNAKAQGGRPYVIFPELFKCIGCLAETLGEDIRGHLVEMLPRLMSSEFCQNLIDCLSKLAQFVPSLNRKIQIHLLTTIELMLHGNPSHRRPNLVPQSPIATRRREQLLGHSMAFRSPKVYSHDYSTSTPIHLESPPVRDIPHTPGGLLNFLSPRQEKHTAEQDRVKYLILCLSALGTVTFDCVNTTNLVKETLVPFLDHDSLEVRRRTIYAIARLIIPPKDNVVLRQGFSSKTVIDVVRKLILITLTDNASCIREAVFEALDSRFDIFLAQPEILKYLFLFLNEPQFKEATMVISLLGRLSKLNPAYIYPFLRTVLMNYMKELSYNQNIQAQELVADRIGLVLLYLPNLVLPYTDPIISVMMDKVKNAESSQLASNCMKAIGNLVTVVGEELMESAEVLMPVVMNNLADHHSTAARKVSVKTLGQIIFSTGYSIDPLEQYPTLLDTIIRKIIRSPSKSSCFEWMRLLGIVGAVDPHIYKSLQISMLEGDSTDQSGSLASEVTLRPEEQQSLFNAFLRGVSVQSEDYFSTVVLDLLMRFLKNPYGKFAHLQMTVIQAVMTIFKSMGVTCVPYLKHFIPPLIDVMEICGNGTPGLREFLFQQFCVMVQVIQHFSRDYIHLLVPLMEKYWDNTNIVEQVISLLEELSIALPAEFSDCLMKFLPKMLTLLWNGKHVGKVLHAFRIFGNDLDPFVSIIVPPMLNLFNVEVSHSRETTEMVIDCLSRFADIHDLSDHAAPIMHALLSVVEKDSYLSSSVFSAVSYILPRISRDLALIFGDMFIKRMKHISRDCSKLVELYYELEQGATVEIVSSNFPATRTRAPTSRDEIHLSAFPQAGKTNDRIIKVVWNTHRRITSSDWVEWFRKISIALLQESPSPALRCVSGLAVTHQPVARELFNAAFISCWDQIGNETKKFIIMSLNEALVARSMPEEILHIILDVVEFMERCEKPLPLDFAMLGKLSTECNAYAKALHYKEELFKKNPEKQLLDLSTLYYNLDLHESGRGIFIVAQKDIKTDVPIFFLEKLQQWRKVLKLYEEKQKEEPNNLELTLGRMRCMHKLGEWEKLHQLTDETRSLEKGNIQILELSIEACLYLSDFEQMSRLVAPLDPNSETGAFYRAIVSVHKCEYENAREYIKVTRTGCSTRLAALIGESYKRAYPVLVRIHQLAELEEIIKYKTTADDSQRHTMRKLWDRRLAVVQRNVDVWQNILSVRTLVLDVREYPSSWIRFANLLRQQQRCHRASGVLLRLMRMDRTPAPLPFSHDTNPRLRYAYLKVVWGKRENRTEAYQMMLKWVNEFDTLKNVPKKLQARCYIRLAEWELRLFETDLEPIIPTMLEYCKAGIDNDPEWHKGWHSWAIVNYRVLSHYAKKLLRSTETDQDGAGGNTTASGTTSSASMFDNSATTNDVLSPMTSPSLSPNTGRSRAGTIASTIALSPITPLLATLANTTTNNNHFAVPPPVSQHGAKNSIPPTTNNINNGTATTSLTTDTANTVISASTAANTDSITNPNGSHSTSSPQIDPATSPYLLLAVSGFIRSIALSPSPHLQDTLRLLTLWFQYGNQSNIAKAIHKGFEIINIDTWLSVIPQIIARINISHREVRYDIQQLLKRLGMKHPQALVFPITVASNSPIRSRAMAAKVAMDNMRQQHSLLVNEALLVGSEFIRVAILWKEKWFKGLGEASRLYYSEKNIDNMMEVLAPLHEELLRGASTQHERSFEKAFGRDIKKAWACCQEYLVTKKESSLVFAWDLYAHVFRSIKRHLQSNFEKLHLPVISPALVELKDIHLAVPGTYEKSYNNKEDVVTISSIAHLLKVIPSKQRPRKLVIYGSDGKEYPFLLKGHEDIRQDERVMQLFGLVNNILGSNDLTSSHHIFIRRMAAIPLSDESGLIQWLPYSDTLHELLKFYRNTHEIPMEAEGNCMHQFCSTQEYYKLPMMNKLEVFEHALNSTPGDDLERVLWYTSENSELWLDKRTTYTRSLANTSMVGYILGLGDRHPNNLMLNRNSGKVIHIDFGDCFEVAMSRETFAEKVPFRLTRMLVKAMEHFTLHYETIATQPIIQVSGIEGNFRTTAENVMTILRNNKESLIAVLEAFVYDPLVNWRLTRAPAAPSPLNEELFTPASVSSPLFMDGEDDSLKNDQALKVLSRVNDKLSGRDFVGKGKLNIKKQVDLLIEQASSNELLSQCFLGWCPYW